MHLGALPDYAEGAASPTGSIVREVEHVRQEWNGVDYGLSWSNGSELDHCLGILQHDKLYRITGTPRACPWASYVFSVEVLSGAIQTEQKFGGWREALENEMNLKDSEAYHRPTGSKYLVGSSSAPYCNSRYPTHMVVMDARTQQVLVDQLFSVEKCVRLARLSER